MGAVKHEAVTSAVGSGLQCRKILIRSTHCITAHKNTETRRIKRGRMREDDVHNEGKEGKKENVLMRDRMTGRKGEDVLRDGGLKRAPMTREQEKKE